MSQQDFNSYAADWLKQKGLGALANAYLPGAGGWISPMISKDPVGGLLDNATGYIPLKQTLDFSAHLRDIVGNIGGGIGNSLHDVIYSQGRSGSSSTTLNSPTAGTTPMACLPAPQASPANQTVAAASVSAAANAGSAKPAAPSGAGSGGTTSSGGGSPTTTYTVKAGDTLGNIGYNFGSSATAIGAANGIQNLNLIHPGQVLTIPRR